MKLDILAFGAHPDDTELGCSGTLARLVQDGLSVGVTDLTRGEMGTRGTPELRMEEATAASELLGLASRDNLGLKDTLLVNTRENQLPIIRSVRHHRPHICLVGAPADRHPDHGAATRLLLDAIFYSGLRRIETIGPDGKAQAPHRPAHILHYMQDRPFEPDFVMDISDTMEVKEKAIRAFSSQFDVADPGSEPETYISSPGYFQGIRARARHFGHLAGFTYGEPFLYVGKPIPLSGFDLFRQTAPKR